MRRSVVRGSEGVVRRAVAYGRFYARKMRNALPARWNVARRVRQLPAREYAAASPARTPMSTMSPMSAVLAVGCYSAEQVCEHKRLFPSSLLPRQSAQHIHRVLRQAVTSRYGDRYLVASFCNARSPREMRGCAAARAVVHPSPPRHTRKRRAAQFLQREMVRPARRRPERRARTARCPPRSRACSFRAHKIGHAKGTF